MAVIRWVCISDLHCGEEYSLLTQVGDRPGELRLLEASPVGKALADCLRTVIGDNPTKPTLILNGDMLELGLAVENEAAMAFESFAEQMARPEPLFARFVYIPGNHDHHLWEVARQQQYVRNLQENCGQRQLHPAEHATGLFQSWRSPCDLMSQLLRRSGLDAPVHTAYPNFGLWKQTPSGLRSVIFSHGHLTEPLYSAPSRFRDWLFPHREQPQNVSDLEAENFAWNDFLWSALGRSREIGKQMEVLYERAKEPDDRKRLLAYVAKRVAQLGLGARLAYRASRWLLTPYIRTHLLLERQQSGAALSKKGREGLAAYLEFVRQQILTEKAQMPDEISFVYGHTHKPFCEELALQDDQLPVRVYNTGGWVVDSKAPQCQRGGAIVFVDEDLNVAQVTLYKESEDQATYKPRVKSLSTDGDWLCEEIESCMSRAPGPWEDFARTVVKEVSKRAQHLAHRTAAPLTRL